MCEYPLFNIVGSIVACYDGKFHWMSPKIEIDWKLNAKEPLIILCSAHWNSAPGSKSFSIELGQLNRRICIEMVFIKMYLSISYVLPFIAGINGKVNK